MRFVETIRRKLAYDIEKRRNEMPNTNTKSVFGSAIEVLAVVGLLLHVLLVLATWNLLPESIPVHFDFAGQPDAWGARTELLIMLGLNVLVYVGSTWLTRYPQKFNYPWKITEHNAARQYALASSFMRVIKLQTVWLFAIIALQMIGISFGLASGLGYLFVPAVLAATSATVIGYFVVASRSAFEESGH
jgi:uncharacterized membrane protein